MGKVVLSLIILAGCSTAQHSMANDAQHELLMKGKIAKCFGPARALSPQEDAWCEEVLRKSQEHQKGEHIKQQ